MWTSNWWDCPLAEKVEVALAGLLDIAYAENQDVDPGGAKI
jgi:hypothetical protein